LEPLLACTGEDSNRVGLKPTSLFHTMLILRQSTYSLLCSLPGIDARNVGWSDPVRRIRATTSRCLYRGVELCRWPNATALGAASNSWLDVTAPLTFSTPYHIERIFLARSLGAQVKGWWDMLIGYLGCIAWSPVYEVLRCNKFPLFRVQSINKIYDCHIIACPWKLKLLTSSGF